jgi:tetratricopeptide (TPR) repeat protein
MSPEQVQAGQVDPRSDVFSVGIVLYEMIARSLPFKGDHEIALAYAILSEEPDPLAQSRSDAPPGLQEVIDRALAKDQSARYPDAAAMLADLDRVRQEIAGTVERRSDKPSRKPTKRKEMRSVSLPLAAGAVVVVAVIAILLFGLPKRGEKQGNGALATNSLAVMYFDNLAEPDDKSKTSEMITSLLITVLTESQYLQVTSRQRLFEILEQLGKGAAATIDHTTAAAIAAKAKVKWMITGEVMQLQPFYLLNAAISDVETGQVVMTKRVSSEPGENLFALVDKLGAALRTHVALPAEAQSEQLKPVAEVTTQSEDAYRYYIEGVELNRKFYSAEGLASLKKAVAADSTFAMAWYELAIMYDWTGAISGVERSQWLANAERYADRTTWIEEQYIRAFANRRRRDLPKAKQVYEEIVSRYPAEKEALRRLALLEAGVNNQAEGVKYLERALVVDSSDKNTLNLMAYLYNDLDSLDKSLWAINRYIELAPDEANPYDTRAEILSYNNRPHEAIASFREAMKRNPEFAANHKIAALHVYIGEYDRADSVYKVMANSQDRDVRSQGRGWMTANAAYQGRFLSAIQQVETGIGSDQMEGYDGEWAYTKLFDRAKFLAGAGRMPEAVKAMQHACEKWHEYDPSDVDYGRLYVVYLAAKSGDFDLARRTKDDLRRDAAALPDTVFEMSKARIAAGYIALFEGRAADAMQIFDQDGDGSVVFNYCYARACLETDRAQDAATQLEHRLGLLDVALVDEPQEAVLCIYLLGRAYEKLGQKDKAIAQYKRFLETWKNAEVPFAEIDDAKTRLASLE